MSLISLISLFENQVLRNSANVALVTELNEEYSYSDLNRLAEDIKTILLQNITSDDRSENASLLIAVMMEREVGFISSVLGILKSNAAYVPIDPVIIRKSSHNFNQFLTNS